MKNKKAKRQSEKEQLKILNELTAYASRTKGLLKPTKEIWNGEPMYKTEIRMCNEFELILKIESIIRLCVFTLEGEGTYSSETLYNYDSDVPTKQRNSAICTALELVLTMLPKWEIAGYVEMLEKLSAIESDDKPKENEEQSTQEA